MAHIIGQLESLKTLRNELNYRNVSMFNSIKEVQDFKKNFKSIKNDLQQQAASDLTQEIKEKQESLKGNEKLLSDRKQEILLKLQEQELKISSSLNKLKSRDHKNKNLLLRIFLSLRIQTKSIHLAYIRNNHERFIARKTKKIQSENNRKAVEIKHLIENEHEIVKSRIQGELNELNRTYGVINELGTIIAGAIGEGKVEKQLRKLSNSFYILNDYSVKFNPPLLNSQTNEKIFSIQIDHVVIGPTGIFIIETKNWSQRSVQSLSLRSPIQQIQRSSYALFVLMNRHININTHHWGAKKIGVKNVLVMTQASTEEKFKFVTIKSLSDLNGYLTYFDHIYSNQEVMMIKDALLELGD